MTNNANARLTPADIEFVPVTDIAVADILVHNAHTTKQHANETPTARKLATAKLTVVTTVNRAVSPRNHEIVEINAALSSRITVLVHNPHANDTTHVWRVRRDAA